ncbi:Hypothetical predicted protein, partial [Marmota monax]
KIFPKGLPEEFSVAAVFRVRRNTKKERWFLWQVLNQKNMPQISVIIDGGKKVVEFMFRAAGGDMLNYIFKNRELRPLFDRQWHKLGFSIQSQVLSLYVDCSLIASRQTDAKDTVDFHGRTVLVARAADGKPVDISVIIDGGKKVVEFMFRAAGGDMLNYIFKNRELRPLFDRQWHKLGFSIQSQVLSLYVDCSLIASRQTDGKDTVDFHGRTVLVARAADGKPVDIELHQLKIYCNANFITQETCCEISATKCPEQDDFGSTASSSVTAHASKLSTFLPAKQEFRDLCQCFPSK